ncbi:Predicted nucleotide-utilizing enzyme [Sphingobium faniae]|nr:Predicted nucleotide-utilizing enzyme [Sphingobium faniae]
MMGSRQPTAALIVIASEVLSGRTNDSHIGRLAHWSREQGLALRFACVIPDDRQAIIDMVRLCESRFDHVFTAGGLGATHDDITVSAVAEALGRPIERNVEAETVLRAYYGERLRDAHLKLADLPRGAELVLPDDRKAGVIRVGKVVLLAGIPDTADAMLAVLCDHMPRGPVTYQRTLGTDLPEEVIAAELEAQQAFSAGCAIASYPLWRNGRPGTNLVLEGLDPTLLASCADRLIGMIAGHGGNVIEGGIDREG